MTRTRTRLIHVLTAGIGLAGFGCSQQVEQTTESTGQAPDELYRTGTPWPFHTAFVCYDPIDGNNPALLAEARRVLTASWGRAANIAFPGVMLGAPQAIWLPCDYSLNERNNYSAVAIHFCGGASNSEHCPAAVYDGNVVQAGAFRGMSTLGAVSPAMTLVQTGSAIRAWFSPGITHLSLIADDPDRFQTRFRYQVIHEFGHALAYEHEQNRPDNLPGNPAFCGQSVDYAWVGVYETPFLDRDSIMGYCARDPLTGSFPSMLSNGDILGVRNTYGRLSSSHGFLILSDTSNTLAVSAFNGAVSLQSGCTINNPDCTWSYQRGMIVSDADPSLAISASGGAAPGVLGLSRACKASDPDCTWTYKAGQFLSDRNRALAISAAGGIGAGAPLQLTSCTSSTPYCTWTLPHVMLSSNRNSTLAVNAFNGAVNGRDLKLHNACEPSNTDCTWTFTRGMIISDKNMSLAIKAFNGARQLGPVQLNSTCTPSNPDCTWTWSHGELVSDNTSNGRLPINALYGAVHLADLKLNSACTASNPDCVFSGLFARN